MYDYVKQTLFSAGVVTFDASQVVSCATGSQPEVFLATTLCCIGASKDAAKSPLAHVLPHTRNHRSQRVGFVQIYSVIRACEYVFRPFAYQSKRIGRQALPASRPFSAAGR